MASHHDSRVVDPFASVDPRRLAELPWLRHVVHLPETGSTNDFALKLAADPELPTPALVIANRQTAGRGRGANRWWSAPGGLTLTLLIEPEQHGLPEARWPQLSLATGVAVSDLAAELAGEPAGVKWPNDVFCRGRKIAGILIESSPHLAPAKRLAIGIGVNVNNAWSEAPAELQATGAAICEFSGVRHALDGALASLLAALARRYEQLADGAAELPAAWQSRCVLRGRYVEVEQGERSIAGTCAGIDEEGALVIATAAGPQRLLGGVVRHIAW